MKQTAVEWLEKEISARGPIGENVTTWLKELYEQAKAMEREQIIDAHNSGYSEGIYQSCESGEEYYNETFKSE